MTRARPTTSVMPFIFAVVLFLLSLVIAVAPLSMLYRSLGIIFCAYLARGLSGMPIAYMIALLAPPVALINNDNAWLIMLPIILSSNLLAMLGLEYAWRYAAMIVSPMLYGLVPFFVWQVSQRELFAVDLPWNPEPETWVLLHVLTALAGMLIALVIDRRRHRQPKQAQD